MLSVQFQQTSTGINLELNLASHWLLRIAEKSILATVSFRIKVPNFLFDQIFLFQAQKSFICSLSVPFSIFSDLSIYLSIYLSI